MTAPLFVESGVEDPLPVTWQEGTTPRFQQEWAVMLVRPGDDNPPALKAAPALAATARCAVSSFTVTHLGPAAVEWNEKCEDLSPREKKERTITFGDAIVEANGVVAGGPISFLFTCNDTGRYPEGYLVKADEESDRLYEELVLLVFLDVS